MTAVLGYGLDVFTAEAIAAGTECGASRRSSISTWIVRCVDVAVRDIAAGEELTVDYRILET
ncbi:MAG TPA: SET domain-containing protein [Burkholderiales bacterium]|nr:SET domain-containing protein [Burkholderiales bacterium]